MGVYICSGSKGRKSDQEQWPLSQVLQIHTETLPSEKQLVDQTRGFRTLVNLLPEYSSGDNTPAYPVLSKPLQWMPSLWGTAPHDCRVLRQVMGWRTGCPVLSEAQSTRAYWAHTIHSLPSFTSWRHGVHGGIIESWMVAVCENSLFCDWDD